MTYPDNHGDIVFEWSLGGNATWMELFGCYNLLTIVGLTSQMFGQLNSMNALLYFLPENLTRERFNAANAYVLPCKTSCKKNLCFPLLQAL